MPIKSYQDDLLIRLENSNYAATYLKVALDEMLEDGHTEAFLLALKNVAQVNGRVMEGLKISQQRLISRKHLYRLLAGDGNPTLETLVAVLNSRSLG